MDKKFWNNRWENNQIGFHQKDINDFLQRHFSLLNMSKGETIFVPLCGKSLDMLWLAEQGVDVLGVEFSEKGIKDFFNENQLGYKKNDTNLFTEYRNENIQLLAGDFFDMETEYLGSIKAVFERAALIALPVDIRADYVNHLAQYLTTGCRILMITMEYPKGAISGPPFAIFEDEVKQLFNKDFSIKLIESKQNEAMGKKLSKATDGTITEKVWLIEKN